MRSMSCAHLVRNYDTHHLVKFVLGNESTTEGAMIQKQGPWRLLYLLDLPLILSSSSYFETLRQHYCIDDAGEWIVLVCYVANQSDQFSMASSPWGGYMQWLKEKKLGSKRAHHVIHKHPRSCSVNWRLAEATETEISAVLRITVAPGGLYLFILLSWWLINKH